MILTIHFLQSLKPPVLPILRPKDSNYDEFEDEDTIYNNLNTDSISQLFFKFFVYYGSCGSADGFHWMDRFVSIRSETCLYKGNIDKLEDIEFQSPILERNNRWWRVCIEDPIELDRDLAGVIHTFEGQIHVINETRRALTLLLRCKNGNCNGENCFEELCSINESVPHMKIICQLCKGEGHSLRFCPRNKCHRCGKSGHIADECPNIICFICKGLHQTSICPQRILRGTSSLDWGHLVERMRTDENYALDTERIMENFPDVQRCGYGSDTMYNEVLRWGINDFVNSSLFRNRVQKLPEVFPNCTDFSNRCYTFVLEEIRAQIERVVSSDFNGVNSYNITIIKHNLNLDKFEGKKLITLDIKIHCNNEKEKLLEMPPALALFVENAPGDLTQQRLQRRKHLLVNIRFPYKEDKNEVHVLCEDVILYEILLANSALAHELIEDGGYNWTAYMIGVGSFTSERICNALGRLKGPSFMRDFLSGVSARRPSRAPLGNNSITAPFVGKLNDSQRNVVEKILDVGLRDVPFIQLIKGPPGETEI